MTEEYIYYKIVRFVYMARDGQEYKFISQIELENKFNTWEEAHAEAERLADQESKCDEKGVKFIRGGTNALTSLCCVYKDDGVKMVYRWRILECRISRAVGSGT